MAMSIDGDIERRSCQARVEGDITVYTVDSQREALLIQCQDLASRGMGVLDMDASGVTEMDAAGMQLLVALKKHLEEMNWELRLCKPSGPVREVLEQTRLTQDFLESNEEDGL
jgi:anti-sigma B factor antagonist